MIIKRGEIWIANLNPKQGKEVGKTRPVLVIQSDFLNEVGHTTTIIVPISSKSRKAISDSPSKLKI
jgi:mRNA interferase MazF